MTLAPTQYSREGGNPSGGWTMDAHSNTVVSMLKDGLTLQEALAKANKDYPPTDGLGEYMPMQLVGDPFSRISYVYLGAVSEHDSRRYMWYIVF